MRMIGIFDSGSGGLSVLRAIRARAPQADIIYFGDLLHAPYGNRSRKELDMLTASSMEFLRSCGASHIVSACNSVSVSTKPMCTQTGFPFENVIEMVGPTAHSFLHARAKVLVVATKATVESGIYQNEFKKVGIDATGLSIPELVSLIERGGSEQEMQEVVHIALAPVMTQEYTHLVLGCTHFPLVRNVFERDMDSLGFHPVFVDPADAVARAVMTHFDTRGRGRTRVIVSKFSPVFERFLASVFPQKMPEIEVI